MSLALALILDALMGEPRWLWGRVPHPAVLMGRLIDWGEARFNNGTAKRAKGALFLAFMCLGMALLAAALSHLGIVVEIVIAAILLAQRSLAEHVAAVATGLRAGLAQGRQSVAMIVGRDTAQMQEADVARAAIESAAENLSDGVVAPAFWFFIAGLPAIMIYKVVNTADSMIGHRTARFEAFGWAAARLDDLLNLVPARLSALLIAALSGGIGRWGDIQTEARRHRSPNAGWPEAAMARALDAALAGPRRYNGVLAEEPFVNPDGRKGLGPHDIEAAVRRLWQAWGALLASVLLLHLAF